MHPYVLKNDNHSTFKYYCNVMFSNRTCDFYADFPSYHFAYVLVVIWLRYNCCILGLIWLCMICVYLYRGGDFTNFDGTGGKSSKYLEYHDKYIVRYKIAVFSTIVFTLVAQFVNGFVVLCCMLISLLFCYLSLWSIVSWWEF